MDGVFAQLPPEQQAELKNAQGLKAEMAKAIQANPEATNELFSLRAKLKEIAPDRLREGGMAPAAAPLLGSIGIPIVGEVVIIAGVAYMVAKGGKLVLDAAREYWNTTVCPDITTTTETVDGILSVSYIEGVTATDIASNSEGVVPVDPEVIGGQLPDGISAPYIENPTESY